MNELNVYDLFADTLCGISHPCDVYGGGVTEGGSAVEGGVRVEECILLCWGLYTRRICEGGVGEGEVRGVGGGGEEEGIVNEQGYEPDLSCSYTYVDHPKSVLR